MRMLVPALVLALFQLGRSTLGSRTADASAPTVAITVLVRNKAHTLPYFLSCLMQLSYPKERIYLWFHTDYNEDASAQILKTWAQSHIAEYAALVVGAGTSGPMPGCDGAADWCDARMEHVMLLRETALTYARQYADFLFMLDADVYLTNPKTLDMLIAKKEAVVAPMLLSEGLYSNFWAGMTEAYYYRRTDDYKPILHRDRLGCHAVPMVHSAVLVALKGPAAGVLTYLPEKVLDYDGPRDDIITFAVSAQRAGETMKVCNEEVFGFVQLPGAGADWRAAERAALAHAKLEALALGWPLPLAQELAHLVAPPALDPLPVAKVYLINLPRRSDRRARMLASLRELGIEAQLVEAVDGRDIDMGDLERLNVTLMPGYEDPYHKRPMKAGEVGCFLSHLRVWEDMVATGASEALVLEDDVRFEPHFRSRLQGLLEEVQNLDWELLYIGRKVLTEDEEPVSEHAVRPSYSYWTLGYVLRARGAQRLLGARPTRRLLPVDEFLPIMFDRHPNETWKAHYPVRRLVALSAAPLLVTPTHYTGQPGYVSDTEDSPLLAPPAAPRDDL